MELFRKILGECLGYIWILGVTALSIGGTAWAIKWMLSVLGVIV